MLWFKEKFYYWLFNSDHLQSVIVNYGANGARIRVSGFGFTLRRIKFAERRREC